MKKSVLSIICGMACLPVFAQESGLNLPAPEDIFESIPDFQENEDKIEELQENILYLENHPVDLNRCSRDELNGLIFLSPSQTDSILAFREAHGPFLAIEELKFIDGLDANTIRQVSPFITVTPKEAISAPAPGNWLRKSRKSLITRYSRRIELPAGYSTGDNGPAYLGNPDRYLIRYHMTLPGKFSAGFATEKDPGEPVLWSPRNKYYGFDHFSYHLAVHNCGMLKTFVAGDYKVMFGQGLVFGNGFYMGKSADPIICIRNRASGLRPFSGTGESGFMRGFGALLEAGHWQTGLFFSRKKVDATIESPEEGIGAGAVVRSINQSGLHRTLAEFGRRKNLTETTAGCRMVYRTRRRNLSLGLTASYSHFSAPMEEKPTYYNQFDFSGDRLFLSGFDYQFLLRKFLFIGESAFSGGKGFAMVNGVMANLSKHIEAGLHVRYYSRDFQGIYSNAFREASDTGNEEGIYWGLRILPVKNLTLNFYSDIFRFPWLRYGLRGISSGNDLLARMILNFPGQVVATFQFQYKNKDGTGHLAATGIDPPVLENRLRTMLRLLWSPNPNVNFQSGFRFSRFGAEETFTFGWAAHFDATWKKEKYSIHTRVAFFNTDDYNNRQYLFEKGALYDFQVPVFSGKGARIYALASGKIGNFCQVWIKLGRTIYPWAEFTGTGNEEIPGNHRTDVTLQAEINI